MKIASLNTHTVLILGANSGQADLIRYFKERGWRVVSCSNRKGEPGEKISDTFILTDATDVEAIGKIVTEQKVDLVYSVASDVVSLAVIEVSKRFGLPYFFDTELVSLLNNKVSLRTHLRQNDLCNIRFMRICSVDECHQWKRYPCVVKPADSQGQRGVFKVNMATMLPDAAKASLVVSKTRTAIIEDYLDGVEISCNVLVSDGQLIICEFSERFVHQGDYFGLPKGHMMPPANISGADLKAAENMIRQVITALSIKRGPLYFQMKVTSKGPQIIEIAPRIDGCHIWRLMNYAKGIDYFDLTIRCLLGEQLLPRGAQHLDARPHQLQFQQLPPGYRLSANDFSIPSNALYHEYRYDVDETVEKVNGKYEVVGYYVIQNSDQPVEDLG